MSVRPFKVTIYNFRYVDKGDGRGSKIHFLFQVAIEPKQPFSFCKCAPKEINLDTEK